jgi:hypothetical protein
MRHRPDAGPYRGTSRPHRKRHVQLRAGDPKQAARNNAALPTTRNGNDHKLPAGSPPRRESETAWATTTKPQRSTRPQLLRSHVFPPQLSGSVALLPYLKYLGYALTW